MTLGENLHLPRAGAGRVNSATAQHRRAAAALMLRLDQDIDPGTPDAKSGHSTVILALAIKVVRPL